MPALFELLKEDNIHVEKQKSSIQNLIKKIGSSPRDSTTGFLIPWKIVIPATIVLVGVIIAVTLIIRKRKNNFED